MATHMRNRYRSTRNWLCQLDARNRGFTLLELLVVIAIIGTLAAIAVLSYQRYRDRAHVAATAVELRSIQTALEAYYSEFERYPPNVVQRTTPSGLARYLSSSLFTVDTPVTGDYDWDGPDVWPRGAISIRDSSRTDIFQSLDRAIDDGDLATGRFRIGAAQSGVPGLIIYGPQPSLSPHMSVLRKELTKGEDL